MTRQALRHFVVPLLLTGGLVVWLFTRISPSHLMGAAGEIAWLPMLVATAAMVAGLFFWDAACLMTIYSIHHNRWSYRESLRLRGVSYLGGCINYELGQAALAWGLARLQGCGIMRMLSRSVLLAYHDVFVLLSASLFGSLLTNDPRVTRVRPFLVIAVIVAVVIALFFKWLPQSIRDRYRRTDSESFLDGWSIGRSSRLILMRIVYFGILVVYALVALRICEVPMDPRVAVSAMPLVLLADGLPSFAGLGTRETSMQLLLDPGRERAPVLLAMSFFWSTGLLTGRMAIALVTLWLGRIDGNGSAAVTDGKEAVPPTRAE
ncbi:MAG TPA: hypothetical protein VH107_04190 [Lacipirellulaceae bacterium]|jgi:hypothetical protein|nr:hypothetical protein [Lacipirellulaceae bacterium]